MCRLRYYHRVSKGFVPLFLCRDGGALFTLLDSWRVFNKDFMVVNLHMYPMEWIEAMELFWRSSIHLFFDSLAPLVGYTEIFQGSGCPSIGLLWVHRVSEGFISLFVALLNSVRFIFTKMLFCSQPAHLHLECMQGMEIFRCSFQSPETVS